MNISLHPPATGTKNGQLPCWRLVDYPKFPFKFIVKDKGKGLIADPYVSLPLAYNIGENFIFIK